MWIYCASEPRRRGILDEGLRAVGRDQLNAALGEHGVADLLDHQVARKPARGLHDDRADAVPLDPLEHGDEAGAALDRVAAAHGGIIELVYHVDPGPPSKPLNGLALSPVAVLICPDVRRA